MSLGSVTAVILAGGLGTRLRSAVPDRPKAMAEVAGRPFLAHLLGRLESAGVGAAVLCVGHLGERIRDAFGAGFGALRLGYAWERELLGTGGALRNALPLVDTETVLALNGDSWCEGDLAAFLDWHGARDSRLSLMLTRVPDSGRFGAVEVDAGGAVTRFLEKSPEAGPGWINAGLYLAPRATLAAIPAGRVVSLERDIFPALIGRGLYGWQGGGRFIDIGTGESYGQADAFFAGLGR